jgi:GT2 family glycosyltransferase
MSSDRIAVILTCFNRRAKTLECLEALFQQSYLPKAQLDVYLTDDGSTDGTAEAVKQAYPNIQILQGDGNLFWCGGMNLAFAEALKGDYDFYLWLNDDTILYPDALDVLMQTYTQLSSGGNPKVIISGSTQDRDTREHTYGGVVRDSALRPLKFRLLTPTEQPQPCDTINGNCVLISKAAAQVVGNVDLAFTHYAGDYDYGLRAQKQGCQVYIPPGYVGTCSSNPTGKSAPPVQEGLKKIAQPKGVAIAEETLHPIGEWRIFAQRYGGPFWFIYWLVPYRRLLWMSWRKRTAS